MPFPLVFAANSLRALMDPSLGPMKVIEKKIRGSRLAVLSPAGHFSNRDQPEAFNQAVLQFLARRR